jgi:hypothetical protein
MLLSIELSSSSITAGTTFFLVIVVYVSIILANFHCFIKICGCRIA